MRVQLENQTLRLRLQEDEFQRLLDGRATENRTHFPDGRQVVQRVHLADTLDWKIKDDTWSIQLPGTELRAYNDQLPTRDGLDFSMDTPGGALTIRFDVDVRDSVRQRHPSKDDKDQG